MLCMLVIPSLLLLLAFSLETKQNKKTLRIKLFKLFFWFSVLGAGEAVCPLRDHLGALSLYTCLPTNTRAVCRHQFLPNQALSSGQSPAKQRTPSADHPWRLLDLIPARIDHLWSWHTTGNRVPCVPGKRIRALLPTKTSALPGLGLTLQTQPHGYQGSEGYT